MENRYENIIHLPHPQPKHHPRMERQARAAQFAPFAALSGYGDAIDEEARETEGEKELSQDARNELGRVLHLLCRGDRVSLTAFVPDELKAGGSYQRMEGTVQRIDARRACILFQDGTGVPFDTLLNIDVLQGNEGRPAKDETEPEQV